MFPFVLSSVSEAYIAATRISAFLGAEELQDPYLIDRASANAVDIDADFTWEVTAKAADTDDKKKPKATKAEKAAGRKAKKDKASILPTTKPEGEDVEKNDEAPFELKNVKFTVRKGDFVAIIGRIGSGKSSLLQRCVLRQRDEPDTDYD
jgi:ATP-binding cassette subfamily C (CFTR/MRP) protein 1